MLIKKATENDLTLIRNLAVQIWHAYYPGIISIQQIEYMLNKMYTEQSILQQMEEGQHYFIAFRDDSPIGYLSYSTKNNRDFFLHKLYVITSLHNKGTGSLLFDHLLKLLPAQFELRLNVNRQNIKAINFYFRKGFIIEEAKDFDIGNEYFMNDFVMIKSQKKSIIS